MKRYAIVLLCWLLAGCGVVALAQDNWSRDDKWASIQYPQVIFKDANPDAEGSRVFRRLIMNPDGWVKECVLKVCQTLYRDPAEMPKVRIIRYTIQDYDGISEKGGHGPELQVRFSTKYLADYYAKHGEKETLSEMAGILMHEITHAYQLEPQGIGSYVQGSEFWSLIEGEADGVRIHTGCMSYSFRKPGGNWMDGYKTTGFFLDWLCTKDSDFIYKLNLSMKTVNPWGWEPAIQSIFAQPVRDLWDEYQKFLKSSQGRVAPKRSE